MQTIDFRFGSLADFAATLPNVRFVLESGPHGNPSSRPLSAKGRHGGLLEYLRSNTFAVAMHQGSGGLNDSCLIRSDPNFETGAANRVPAGRS